MTELNLLHYNKGTLVNMIKKLEEENERLSKEVDMWNRKYNEQFNIIDELEKWINKNKQWQVISERCIVWEDKLLDKLKELKENRI